MSTVNRRRRAVPASRPEQENRMDTARTRAAERKARRRIHAARDREDREREAA